MAGNDGRRTRPHWALGSDAEAANKVMGAAAGLLDARLICVIPSHGS